MKEYQEALEPDCLFCLIGPLQFGHSDMNLMHPNQASPLDLGAFFSYSAMYSQLLNSNLILVNLVLKIMLMLCEHSQESAIKSCIQMEQKCLQCVPGLHYSNPFCAVRISLPWVPCCVFA